jgi:glucokinase
MQSRDRGRRKTESMVGAVDIGGTKIAVGTVDAVGRVLRKIEFPTDVPDGFENAMQRTAAALRECAAGASLRGIGIGCTGQLDAASGMLGNVNNLPGWEGSNPVDALTREFDLPVAIENDADAVALGEVHWGAARSKSRLVFVTVGTGIGASVILDGKIYRGVAHCHPEIGHHIIDPAGPMCTCGAQGCWESWASGTAMAQWARQNAPADCAHKNLSARQVCELAEQGEDWAQRAVEHEARYLGIGLANLVVIFAPQAIVLGGSVMKSAHLFMDRIREMIRLNCRLVPHECVEIVLASLGPDVGLIGAAQVWHHRFEQCGGRIE